jgi:hypothetical protein
MRFSASLNKRRVIMTFVVLCIAVLCGQLMQSIGNNPLDRIEKTKLKALPVDPVASGLQYPPRLPGRVNTAAVQGIKAVSLPSTACIPQLKLKRAPGAMIDMAFLGCKAQTVTLFHGGLSFTAKTDAAGRLQQYIPALERAAVVSVSFDGDVIESAIEMPDADAYHHVAIIWEGEQVLNMHAFEFGAKRNQFGHVWSGAPKSPQRATRGNGGFMTQLGDGSGRSADIYSFPSELSQNNGVVRLVVEAAVTTKSCEQQVNAVALQTGPMGGMDTTEVALKMPQCDSIGHVVRLQNLFQDMRLAMR